jgi:hypothetical protein
MRWNTRQTRIEEELNEVRIDPVLEVALKDFRLSVHAWSEAAMNRPRKPIHSAVHVTWRLAVSWALGCLLAAGSVGGGLYERHHRQELARQAAAEQSRQRQMAAEAAAVTAHEQNGAASTREQDEQLLAEVDSDVSREVPSAMEPLAQLMEETGNK